MMLLADNVDALCIHIVSQIPPHTPTWLHAEHCSAYLVSWAHSTGAEIECWSRPTSSPPQRYHSPMEFNAISVPEFVGSSHNKATVVDELNAWEGEE